jgi:hypothetical protein
MSTAPAQRSLPATCVGDRTQAMNGRLPWRRTGGLFWDSRGGKRPTLAPERGRRKLCPMRLRWIGLGLLALIACAQPETEDVAAAPPPAAQDARISRGADVDALAGYVTAHEAGVLKLDSGGPNPIALLVDPSARVMRDGRSASAAEILPGDVVRAAVRSRDDGERVALQVFANSRPPSLLQNPAPAPQQPQARRPPPLRR